jgi:hypothetical protein
MKTQKTILTTAKIFTVFSIFSLAYVSILSLYSPQTTMDLVGTQLPNTDALSLIRAIYGGVGTVISFMLGYLLVSDLRKALLFLTWFWLAYAVSRIITWVVDGPLGAFGNQWLMIESVFGLIALTLYYFSGKVNNNNTVIQ